MSFKTIKAELASFTNCSSVLLCVYVWEQWIISVANLAEANKRHLIKTYYQHPSLSLTGIPSEQCERHWVKLLMAEQVPPSHELLNRINHFLI